ncbi:hypothetical protein [Labrys neptuniae]|uniref:Uncharacterized protein n=1 Tax=Labrys neptuniae TaxID=376174 RepID=A0ABV3PG43_9HYPH
MLTDVSGFYSMDSDRLDLFNINRTPKNILHDLMREAGGDPMVALERLIKRGMEMDDELDAVRLMLDDMRAKDGQPPLVTDRERREPHLRARTALRMQEDEDNGEVDDDDDFTKGELDYMHNLGIDEDAYFAEQPKAAKPAKHRNLRVVQDE